MMAQVASVLVVACLMAEAPAAAAGEGTSAGRDPRLLLERSIVAMGGHVPATSRIVGSVEITAGSETRRGTITCLTRGHGETREIVDAGGRTEDVVYAFGHASERDTAEGRRLSLELMVSSDSVNFPLVTLARGLADPDTGFEFLGEETVDGRAAYHVRLWNTFASTPRLTPVAPLSEKHVWLDVESYLPRKMSFDRRAARGSEPGIPMIVFYSDYRAVGAVLVPFAVEKHYNGTPWMSIRVVSVELDPDLGPDAFRLD